MTLEVDATDTAHGVQHAHIRTSVEPGPLTFAYPKWIPGENAPNGPITQLMNLRVRAGDEILEWRRDPLDAYSFEVIVPPDAPQIDIYFDYVSPPAAFSSGFGNSPSVTPNLLVLMFNQVLIYPVDGPADDVMVEARVRLPVDWSFESSLPARRMKGGEIVFAPAPLTELIDSPLLAGRYFERIPITSAPEDTRLSIAADAPGALVAGSDLIGGLQRLVEETQAVFGDGHFRSYAWQLALSDALRHDGTEHSASSDIRQSKDLFTDHNQSIQWRLFPHEYVHAWNGKYRRPAGLDTINYQQPLNDSLLWVYEGLTRYYADLVLSARSGMATAAQTRDYLAYVAAQMAYSRPGREWRSLADTAVAAPAFFGAPAAGRASRRSLDYYNEMLLVWLEADMIIRRESGRRASLDDFCRNFFAGPERAPAVRPYDRTDIVTALHAVAPFDWEAFFSERIDNVAPEPPLAGVEASGWRLIFSDRPNPFLAQVEQLSGVYNLSFSLGAWVKQNGVVRDIIPGSPAYEAGIGAGVRIVSVNGEDWTITAARDAIAGAQQDGTPIAFVIERGDMIETLHVNYRGGLRYPHLQRDNSQADHLSSILSPQRAGAAAPTSGDPR